MTNQNSVQGEIKRRLKAVPTLLSSRIPFNNLKIKIFKSIILPVVLNGCEV